MSLPLQILAMYAVWFAAIFYVHRLCQKSSPGSVGIPLAYLVTMTFMHCGGLTYAIPGYTHIRPGAHWYLQILAFTEEMVRDGVFASVISVVGIAIGCYLCSDKRRPAQAQAQAQARMAGPSPAPGPERAPRPLMPPMMRRRPPLRSVIPAAMLLVAAAAFAITKLNINLPSVQSIIMAGRNLAIVAVCLGLWIAVQRNDQRAVRLWAAMTVFVPAAYLIGWGFLSYGFMASAVFFAFWMAVSRQGKYTKIARAVVITLGFYLVLSIFTGYMEVRASLRDVLWNNDADMGDRVGAVMAQFSVVRPLNPFNFNQLDWFNIRLNQNMFIGKAMQLHAIAPWLQENGMGILTSLLAWVPRFLWPGKPDMGGNDFVEKHTGMSFSDNTSIGAGPVFELFVNFGIWGVFIGSIVLGWVLRWMDAYCARQLRRRDFGRFIRGYLVSVCLINPMSLIFFLVSSAGASWVLGTGIMYILSVLKPSVPVRPIPPRRPEQEKQAWAS